eukprot:253579-Amphidinium_carterae.1
MDSADCQQVRTLARLFGSCAGVRGFLRPKQFNCWDEARACACTQLLDLGDQIVRWGSVHVRGADDLA